jgi:DnaK suppressor protein
MLPIKELRKKLQARRHELFKEVADIEDDLLWLETDVESEREERAQGENMLRLLARLDDRGKAEIKEIDRAFARIGSGDYGRCELCKKPIPLARLEALPAAATCLPCAQAREKTSI